MPVIGKSDPFKEVVMFRGRIVCLFVVAALLVGATTASAQDEKKWGLGVDLHNQGLHMTSWINSLGDFPDAFGEPPIPLSETMTTHLTPCLLITIRPTPNWFIEPLLGYMSVSGKNAYSDPTDATFNTTEDFSASELKLGLSGIYDLNPSAWLSPYVRGIFAWHKFSASNEETRGTAYATPGTDKIEFKASAFSIAGALGGMVHINDVLFITLEGRLTWASIGDTEGTLSGASGAGTDTNETDGSAFYADMAVGLRMLFF